MRLVLHTLLRSILWLCLVTWVGGLLFFGVVAYTAFTVLPSPHLAGLVVGAALTHLHSIGIVCGALIVGCLMLARANNVIRRSITWPLFLTMAMIGGTAYSQYSIIPAMDRYRAQIPGGEINSVPPSNSARAGFDQLHVLSTRLEQAILLCGIATIVLVARPDEE